MNNKKLDRRRKYYLVLDCETATLPYAINYDGNARKNIAIAKPLIYDLAWQLVDRKGNVYRRKSYIITEIFSVPSIFNTAYYASKRPQYIEKLNNGQAVLTDWNTAVQDLLQDMRNAVAVGAYNSMFDFKKAIPFTEKYISMLYSPDFFKWEQMQNRLADEIAVGKRKDSNYRFNPDVFNFRGEQFALIDVWGLSCRYLLNNDEYRQQCIDNGWTTASGKYFSTSAESAFRYLSKNAEFIESHTALEDVEIESEILAKIIGKKLNQFEIGIIYFPFREIGTVEWYEMTRG